MLHICNDNYLKRVHAVTRTVHNVTWTPVKQFAGVVCMFDLWPVKLGGPPPGVNQVNRRVAQVK